MFEHNYYSASKEIVISTEEVIDIVSNYIASWSFQLSLVAIVLLGLFCFKQNFKNEAMKSMSKISSFTNLETKDLIVGLILLFIPFFNLMYLAFIICTALADIVSNRLNKYLQPIIDTINSKNDDIDDYDPRKDM